MSSETSAGLILENAPDLAEAWQLSRTGQLEAAHEAAIRLLTAATESGDDRTRAGCSLLIGECCLHLGRIDEALEHAQAASRIFDHLGDLASQARARSLYAWTLLTRGDSELALDEVLAALELATATGDAGAQAFALDVAGMVYWLIQQPEKSLPFFEDAIKLARRTGDDVQLGRYLVNLGSVQAQIGLQAQNRGDLAAFERWTRLGIETTAQGLAISRQVGDIWSVRIGLCNTAEHFCWLNDYEAAMRILDEHDEIPGTLDRRAAVHCQFTRGIVLAGLGRFDEAIARFQESLSAELAGDTEQAVTSLLQISKAYESAGRFAEALAAYKKYHALQAKMTEQAVQRRARYVALRLENDQLRALAEAEQHRARNLEAENHDLARTADRLTRAALEDNLTGLSNRRHLEAALFEILVSGEHYAIAMLDVDNFKQINDTFSHAAGDAVLRQIGMLIRQCCRNEDLAVRYGGEEFAILMRGGDETAARALCDRIKSVIEQHNWRTLLENVGVTVSIGAASWSEASSPNNALALADRRLYRAKAEGRNRVVDTGCHGG
jgi:diguanylate cyclase (GGDEF)-like protein